MSVIGARVLAWLKGEEATDILVGRAARGDVAGVETLLDSNVSPSGKARNGRTALYVAVAGGHRDVVWILLQRGADVRVEMPDGDNALTRAAAMGDADLCQKLLVHGANPGQLGADGMSALIFAARGGHVAVIRALLARGANPSLAIGARTKRGFAGTTALLVAVTEGHVDVVELLVAAGARDDRALAAARAQVAYSQGQGHAAQILRLLLPTSYSKTG